MTSCRNGGDDDDNGDACIYDVMSAAMTAVSDDDDGVDAGIYDVTFAAMMAMTMTATQVPKTSRLRK